MPTRAQLQIRPLAVARVPDLSCAGKHCVAGPAEHEDQGQLRILDHQICQHASNGDTSSQTGSSAASTFAARNCMIELGDDNRLMTAKLDQVLLRRLNVQLEGQGLKVAGSRGAIIDATIIESAAHPNQHVEVDDEGQADVVDSADEEARWVKKGKDAFFGYCGYSAVDTEDGYVEHIEVHPANQAEVNKLPGIVDALVEQGIRPEGVLADKGYASAARGRRISNCSGQGSQGGRARDL